RKEGGRVLRHVSDCLAPRNQSTICFKTAARRQPVCTTRLSQSFPPAFSILRETKLVQHRCPLLLLDSAPQSTNPAKPTTRTSGNSHENFTFAMPRAAIRGQ